jgi:probable phosphoglycerate mutase
MDVGYQGDDARHEEQSANGHGEPRHTVLGILQQQHADYHGAQCSENGTLEDFHDAQCFIVSCKGTNNFSFLISHFSFFLYLCIMETEILLVRHGETVDNARQIMQGQTQGELNERGWEQARQVAERLAAETVDAVVASDLRRAIQTAEVIAAPHGLNVETTPLLRERDWGGFTGRFIPDLRGETWPDDIESEEDLLSRARSFLIYMTATYPGKRVVAVGHGIINKAILAVYAHCGMRDVQRMMNAEVRRLTTSAASVAAMTATAEVTSATTATATAE